MSDKDKKEVKKEGKEQIAVFDIRQAEKVGGKFDKKLSSMVRTSAKVLPSYAANVNKNFDVSGRYYELNEKATETLRKAYNLG